MTTTQDDGSAPLTVAEMLALPVLRRGRPEVLAGDALDRREVRWVHTSEIYEISPLLKGGEVLLTTGLGLVGAGTAALRGYVAGLADRSIAALVLELGRTFTSAPPALVTAARDAGLPLIVLRGIVPFIEITESVHALLLTGEVARLRLAEQISAAVTPALLSGAGLTAVLRALAEVARCPVRLYAGDGHLVAASDRDNSGGHRREQSGERHGHEQGEPGDPGDRPGDGNAAPGSWPPLGLPSGATSAPVDLFGRPWGHLAVCGSPSHLRTLVAQRGAVAAALELGRAGAPGPGSPRRRAGDLLLRDIFGRQYSSADDVVGRAAALGVVVRPGQLAVGICLAVDAGPSPAAGAAVAESAERVLGPALVAELDGSYLIAASTDPTDPRGLLDRLADRVDAALPTGRAVAVTGGPAVRDIASLARSLRAAREASVLARRLGSGMRTLLAADLGVHRLLARFAADPELAEFVDGQLGPLLDHDAARGRELVRTLDTLLACGLSKAATARTLGIRRQTLYQRLASISALLGGLDLDSRERRTAIDLALVGWRLRAAAVQRSERRAGASPLDHAG